MTEASIPVDLFNPGQVFACLGFLEAVDVLLGDAEGGFDWRDRGHVRFVLRAGGHENPFWVALNFMATARVSSQAPFGSPNTTTQWDVPTEVLPIDAPFPFPDPPSPATLPAVFDGGEGGKSRLVIDHWGDATSRRDAVKFWGGGGGYPGAALARDALSLVRDRCAEAASDPFGLSAPQSSSYRFDWRRDYIPIDLGFSLNSHSGKIAAMGFPLVEVLAALGLTNARPLKSTILEYRYGVIGSTGAASLFDLSFMRAALGCAALPFPQRRFRMQLGWPAKQGQARAITTVTEEMTV